MSLVAGRGPLSKDPAGWFSSPLPDDPVFVEPHPRRVQAIRNGQVVIDTERALMVHRRDHPLSYVFPADAIGDLPSDPEPQAPGYVHVPGMRSTPGSRRAARSFTTRRIRITASTVVRPTERFGSPPQVRPSSTPPTR